MNWMPILNGEIATEGWKVFGAIADELAECVEPRSDLALFWSYATLAFSDARAVARQELAMKNLELEIAHSLNESHALPLGLYRGLANIGWTTAHVADADDVLEEFDEGFITYLKKYTQQKGTYDLIDGLAGIAVYFLERLDQPSSRVGLQLIVSNLDKTCERAGDDVTWFSPPGYWPKHQKELARVGGYNCGLAHGVAGAVAALARIAEAAPEIPGARELCTRSARWLERQALDPTALVHFPDVILNGQAHRSRSAWCYGDPGILVALWRAAKNTGRPTMPIEEAALLALSRPLDLTGVVDAGLCHGAAGLGHIANRFYHATGDARFRTIAEVWFTQAIEYAQWSKGRVHFTDCDQSFLVGTIGIGLSLFSALTEHAPEWDRILLCDLPVGTEPARD